MPIPADHRLVRRRAVLSALGAALGTAGCGGLFGAGESRRTLTPAPVPTGERTPIPTGEPRRDGPEIPADAAVYVHSGGGAARNRLRLVPGRSRYGADSRRFAFTLENRTDLSFVTGRDRWILAHRGVGGWSVLERGAATDIERVQPDGRRRWVFGETAEGDQTASLVAPRLDVAPSGGHALAITGSFPRGQLVSLVALFDVLPTPQAGSV